MILRRVMSRDHVTSQFLRDFIISSSGRVIVAIGFLLALSALEVNLAPLLAVIGAAGFVVAFALQGTLSNFASGLLIMVFKPFDVGDRGRSRRRHQGQGHPRDHLQHLHPHR